MVKGQLGWEMGMGYILASTHIYKLCPMGRVCVTWLPADP